MSLTPEDELVLARIAKDARDDESLLQWVREHVRWLIAKVRQVGEALAESERARTEAEDSVSRANDRAAETYSELIDERAKREEAAFHKATWKEAAERAEAALTAERDAAQAIPPPVPATLCERKLECGGSCKFAKHHPPPCLCGGDRDGVPGTCEA
jgi:hypothetical protein